MPNAATLTDSATMRAATLVKPQVFEVQEVPLPEPAPTQVRVHIEFCGVCHSNLSPWQGQPWFDYPFAPGQMGHEACGVIDAVGTEVKDWQPGQRVAFLSNNAYAEYDVVDQEMVAALPESLSGQPFPAEPLGCAINVFKRSGIQSGDTVAILGIGFLGAVLIQLAVKAGAKVIAVTRREYALNFARKLGAVEALEIDDADAVYHKIGEFTGWKMCDVVIEVTGKQAPLDLATKLAKERGRLVIAGYHQDGPRTVDMQNWNWKGLDVINAHERDPKVYIGGIREAIQAVTEGTIDPRPLITHLFPLEDIGQAFQLMEDRPTGFMKSVIRM